MTAAAAADIVDATWNSGALCRDCRHCDAYLAMDYLGEGFCRLMEYNGDPFDCPAVEAELDKEIAE